MNDENQVQLKSSLRQANMIIQKLEDRLGSLQGALAHAEAERDLFFEYIQQQSEDEEDEESDKEE